MADTQTILVPDIGDFDEVEIIEVLVSAGDTIDVEDSLVTLETDKATMEVPASEKGRVLEVNVKVGDRVSQGTPILTLTADKAVAADDPAPTSVDNAEPATAAPPPSESERKIDVLVPDIGDFEDVEVIEVLIEPGQQITVEESLVTLETDKATMEVPSENSGIVASIDVKVGDRVSQGDLILSLSTNTETNPTQEATADEKKSTSVPAALDSKPASTSTKEPEATPPRAPPQHSPTAHLQLDPNAKAHASPAVRRFARELGADINLVTGTGRKNRILKGDVKNFIKSALAGAGA
ncbi:MAG: biotin/lipoyl-containing protein, partial [Pseudomonadota bacterium]